MDLSEAEQKRIDYSARRRSGQLTPAQYAKALTSLQVTDAHGTIWQPNPSGDGWIFWNGTSWLPGIPAQKPASGPDPYYIPPTTPKSSGPGTLSPPPRSKDFNEFKSSLMTVDEFKKVSKDVPLAKRPQKWWDLLSILGGVVAAILWFLYGGIRSSREGLDLITPLLMIAIPLILVWFRADIDKILLPFQPHRKKISRILLIGLGIATPFLTAWILYNIFQISQYPLIQANMVVGTLAAYAITRDPQILPGKQYPPGTGSGIAMIILSAMLVSMIVTPVMADDCASDPLNAQDCLRTDGYAEVMAGLITTILVSLVNGPIILQTLLQGGGTGVQPPAPPAMPIPPGPVTPPQTVVPPTVPPVVPPAPSTPPVTPPKTTPDEQKQLEEAMAAMRKKKQEMAAAAAAAKAKAAEAAAKAKAGPPVDPVTGKRILTPEQQARKEELLAEMARNSAEAERWGNYANKLDYAVAGLTAVEKAADIAIDVGATLSPGAGSKIKNIYAATKTIGKNMSQSYVDGKGLVDGLKQGVVEAATDKALDLFAGKVTDKFKGKIPGFGKFDSHTTDYGNMSLSDIKGKLSKNMLNETGELVQDLRNIIQHGDAKNAVSNSLKNAMQGQVQGTTLWDPFKKFFGISK